jgi:hypothetical protein
MCLDDDSPASCGASCTPCPVPAHADAATCDGISCGVVCSAGYTLCGADTCADLASDGANCDTCGHDCLGGACDAGICQPDVLLSGQELVHFLAVDATNLYFTVDPGGHPAGGSVQTLSLAGGNPTTLVSGITGPDGVAVDASFVYWASSADGTLSKIAKGGGPTIPMVSNRPGAFGVAVHDSTLYLTQIYSATVSMLVLPNGIPLTIASQATANGATGIAADSNDVYWGSYSAVYSMFDGGGPVATIADMQNDAIAVAVDDSFVYWTILYGGQVMRAPLSGGPPTTLVPGTTTYAGGIAVDDKAIYWAATDGNEVSKLMRLAK